MITNSWPLFQTQHLQHLARDKSISAAVAYAFTGLPLDQFYDLIVLATEQDRMYARRFPRCHRTTQTHYTIHF